AKRVKPCALRAIAYGADALVAAGHNGRILRTASLVSPTLTGMHFNANTTGFSFDTVNGLTYRIEYINHLSDSSWTLLDTMNGTGASIPLNDRTATMPARLNRV